MAEPADINVDELRRRARRRLVGAVVLALGVAVVVPMLLETEQKPLGEDVSVKIPPVDDSKFVNRLNENRAKEAKSAARTGDEPAKAGQASAPPAPKYDTRIADAPAAGNAAPTTPVAEPARAADAGKASDAGTSASDARAVTTPAPTSTPDTSTANAPATNVKPAMSAPASPAPSSAKEVATAPDAAKSSTATTVANASKTGASVHDGFAVQLAAFADDKGASALAGRLKRAGYAAYTEPLTTSKGTLWRVRVGPYGSREAALSARDKLKSEGQSGIVAAIK
jgi:DedD protein